MSWRSSILLLMIAGVAWGQETPPPSPNVVVRADDTSGRPLQQSDPLEKTIAEHEYDLEHARERGDMASTASTLNSLGTLYLDLHRLEDARKAFEGALETYRKLAGQNAVIYLPHVATTLNNLGFVYRTQNRMEDARKAYEEALASYRQLVTKNPEVFLPYVASALNNFGRLYRDQNRLEDAKGAYDEALEIRRQLAASNPELYLPHVAATLNNLGTLYSDQNLFEDARKAHEDALKIFRQSAAKNPQAYLPEIASTLNDLAILHGNQNRLEDARKSFEEALESYRHLATQNPKAHLPDVALMLNNLAILHGAQNRTEDARKAYQEAVKIRRDVAASNPEVLPLLADSLDQFGNFEAKANHFEAASALFAEGLAAQKKALSLGLPQHPANIAATTSLLALSYAKSGMTAEALLAAQEALTRIDASAPENRDSFGPLIEVLRQILNTDPAAAPKPADP